MLFLAAWYPRQEYPTAGVFVREHARAASLHNDVVVIHVYADETMAFWKPCQATEELEDGIRTIRVRYGKYRAMSESLRRLVSRGPRRTLSEDSSDSARGGRVVGVLRTILAIDGMVLGNLLYVWRVCSACRQVLRTGWKPDIIHAHVVTAGVPATILGKLYRVPVVITEHWSAFTLRHLTLGGRMRARFAMRGARMILPVSGALKVAIEAYGIRSEFRVVPNTIDEGVFHLPHPHTDSGAKGPKRILEVASLSPEKGIGHLLQAIGQLKPTRQDFVLDVVGDGPARVQYEKLSHSLGLEGVARFHGLKTKAEVAEYMMKCDFFVQPTLHETFGVVYAEAMACGKPVIGTRIPALMELIKEDVGILVPPRDVSALSRAIEFMLDHCADFDAEEIARYARERFGYEAVSRMLDEVYNEVTVRGAKAGAD